MKRYAVIFEKGENNYGAYIPDLPGCITTGDTMEQVRENIKEAIKLHLHGIFEDGGPIPEPASVIDFVEVPNDPEEWAKGVLKVENAGSK